MFTLLSLLLRSDLAYRIRDGAVVARRGKRALRFQHEVEDVCRIHGVRNGMLFARWVGHDYRLTVLGELAQARVPLNNVIN